MRDDEPLDTWLFWANLSAEQMPRIRPQDEGRPALERLAQALSDQPEGKVNFDKIRGNIPSRYSTVRLRADDAAEAQRIFFAIWERGGPGANHVIDGLLKGVALAMQTTSIPFWKQLLDLSRPRDQSTTRRRSWALAALALLAIVKDDASAYTALAEAMTHSHEQVRAMAAFYLGRAYAAPERSMPAPSEAALRDLATHDRSFIARFQARQTLRQIGRPIPHDAPDQVYFLKAQLRGDRATRTIAILPDDTLADLHYAIQGAFGWGADHLYSFHMSGGRDDQRYTIRCPELDADGALTDLETTSVEIGTLGLVPKHQFMYFFDYGDNHEFTITVLSIEPQADGGTYPRVIEARGKAPAQYYSYEGDEEGEEGDTW